MPTLTTTVEKLGRKNLMQAVRLYSPDLDCDYAMDMAGKEIKTTQNFEEAAAYGGLGLPSKVNEYGNPPQTEYEEIYQQTFTQEKLMLQFRISNEAFKNEQGYGIVRAYGSDMMANYLIKFNMDAADRFMNLANDAVNNPINGLGEALGSATHALEAGTDTNILSPAETLAPQSVTKAFARLKKTKAHKGHLMPIIGAGVIECSADNELLAEQIRMATGQALEQSNTPNRIGKKISGIIGNPWFSNTEWWAVRVANPKRHGRFVQMREGFTLTHWGYDEDNDSWKATSRKQYIFGVFGWRGVVYSFAV